mgnify:CR=1 FL=1
MVEFESEVKKWGNSWAIVLPKNKFKGTRIRIGKRLRFITMNKNLDLKKEFGSLKHILKKSSQEVKDELRKEEFEIEKRK